jgi:hypothetical protein
MVTLTGGVRLTTTLTVPEGVTLDLTKETLQLANNAIFTVNGTVNAKARGVNIDSAVASPAIINGNGTISLKSKGPILHILEGKKLTLDGVTLVGLTKGGADGDTEDNNDPVVRIGGGGEFVMKSGAITGNSTVGNGGGVSVDIGTFTMEGGKISGNTAKGNAGGVFVMNEGSTFTMSGGEISGNTVNGFIGNEVDGKGGGVSVGIGIFIMSGGEIKDNTSVGRGGGVAVFRAATSFIMEGGAISGNSAATRGGGVDQERGTITMSGGTISGNSAADGGGISVGQRNPSMFTLKGGRIQGGGDSDSFIGNTSKSGRSDALFFVDNKEGTAKWGTDGTYTKGGMSQTGGSDIGSTNDTLIAAPGK